VKDFGIDPSYFKRMKNSTTNRRADIAPQAATTTTMYESPEPDRTVTQSPDLPQQRSSGEEHPEHGQVQEARLNRSRERMPRNWREAARADLPVVLMSHTVRIRTRG
jgi:hypothetical protein